jgi:hypothetical protein
MPTPTNEPNLTLPKSPSDPFYSERNLQHLEQILRDIQDGTAHFAEHNLMED